ncbi:hypothetical protein PsorP6_002121 [Peronosclerospora sorghi]|uniref:Uncharacterized protein n=1 Tax=Peronosclerospora sorghi TaxID=230839 RepID=A0ACC0WRD0_9STRA|nr:hypothetical protein PsorP6_002121 [Peronosclerospora sorghi]
MRNHLIDLLKTEPRSRRGYHLAVPVNAKDLPSCFIERVPTKTVICCSTKPLVSLNVRLNEALAAVYKLSNDVIQHLLDKIRPRSSTMHVMVESVALLDMLLSFVNVVALSPPDQPCNIFALKDIADGISHKAVHLKFVDTRPTVTEHGNLIIKKGRHPLVERVRDQAYIPSDTFFDPLSTFHSKQLTNESPYTQCMTLLAVITGPNCAGKSTYLRATALITILAHMGCYVPASDAVIPIRDRICTRFGTSDDMEENASTFAVEMTETAFILESCTARSLVFIDELGRGTANDEGAAIAWSVGEEMIHRGSYTCFATHYHQLNRLARLYHRCRCYHMGTESYTNSGHFRYVLKDGHFASIGMYGIKTAASSGLPLEIIREAERIYEKLRGEREATENMTFQAETNTNSSRINTNLLHHLYALRYADLDYAGLRRQLQHLRNRFITAAE